MTSIGSGIALSIILAFSSCSSPPLRKSEQRIPEVQHLRATPLQSAVDSILDDSLLAPCIVGVKIASPDDGRTLYERNADKLFHPASNMKLLTTAAALVTLGADARFTTRCSSDGYVSDSVLFGDLFVKGVGDPLINTASLDSLAAQLLQRHIGRISGDLVGDVSYFDSLSWGSGWMWDDEPSTDAPFLTPLSINENAIEIDVQPGRHTGDPPSVAAKPPTSYVRIVNQATTTEDTSLPRLEVTRMHGGNDILLRGRIAPHEGTQEFALSVWKPEFYFLELLRERLNANGIVVEGTARLDTARGRLVLGEISHTLDSVLFRINKPSDNLSAENLLKTIAAVRFHTPGSAALGHSVVKEYLASCGIDTARMILADGSGLSWYNALSPTALTLLLTDQYRRSTTFRRFYESLPVAGVDGTLETRMRGTKAEGSVHAKTGSLTGVSCLSGYVTTADGSVLVVSILCNHFPDQLNYLRSAQDSIMELLAQYRRTP